MKIHFTKMHGLGNDFVVLDATRQNFVPNAGQVRWLANRHLGVGCDQLLVVEKSTRPDVDFRYRIFNADGGEVEHCGNGSRCFLRFVHDNGLSKKREIRVETAKGIIIPRLEDDGQVTVNMGAPAFEPAQIPFLAEREAQSHLLEIGTGGIEISVVSMGNPHAVQTVADIDESVSENGRCLARVLQQGPLIETHPRFPRGVNAGFMQIVDRHSIRLRVWERGVGETLACGTGACAAAVTGIRCGVLDSPVKVQMRGGDLVIAWAGRAAPVMMTGPAVTVFDADIEIPENLD